ncbi:transcriptional regulator [Azorhizobium oxalatiphilum]|uniref:Transcriptional regulator n=1 Tax=Azorhizobium oxalatiphilum TaxID=980631 RepID=A0A917BHU4_9HYPH|nr:addiction module antidote protein [Azorhizobium oxalatiphilum]GGF45213.1 transcriptional regulator [Azorhizobium oxalatiphilum]
MTERAIRSEPTTPWDMADHVDTPEAVAAYLEAAFEDGEPAVIATALGAIARSRGMSEVARQAGVTREALYKALSPDGDPRLSTFLGVLKALEHVRL